MVFFELDQGSLLRSYEPSLRLRTIDRSLLLSCQPELNAAVLIRGSPIGNQ
jgi:hypothetical protein